MRKQVMTAVLTATVASAQILVAQEPHEHEPGEEDHHGGLHFSHPIFTESISPDTKMRLDFAHARADDATESEIEVEAEYAFHPSLSLQLVAPYVFANPAGTGSAKRLGTVELAIKAANYAFAEHGVLLGYGMGVGLPTGSQAVDIGSDHQWELSPFLSAGLKKGSIELVGLSTFSIPVNQDAGEEVETELRYDISGLYHIASRIEGMVEVNGDVTLSGDAAGAGVVRVSPGIKVTPMAGRPLIIGLGASFPLDDAAAETEIRISTFYHF